MDACRQDADCGGVLFFLVSRSAQHLPTCRVMDPLTHGHGPIAHADATVGWATGATKELTCNTHLHFRFNSLAPIVLASSSPFTNEG